MNKKIILSIIYFHGYIKGYIIGNIKAINTMMHSGNDIDAMYFVIYIKLLIQIILLTPLMLISAIPFHFIMIILRIIENIKRRDDNNESNT